jgi:hypothetical protein
MEARIQIEKVPEVDEPDLARGILVARQELPVTVLLVKDQEYRLPFFNDVAAREDSEVTKICCERLRDGG